MRLSGGKIPIVLLIAVATIGAGSAAGYGLAQYTVTGINPIYHSAPTSSYAYETPKFDEWPADLSGPSRVDTIQASFER